MTQSRDDIRLVKQVIDDNPDGISISEVAHIVGIHRNTAAKYLEILHSQGVIEIRRVGVSKLYSPSTRVPLSSVLMIFSEPVLIITRDMLIAGGNDAAVRWFGEEIINNTGTPLEKVISYIGGMSRSELPEIFNGSWRSWEAEECHDGGNCLIRGIPVKFDNGRTGAALVFVTTSDSGALQSRIEWLEEFFATIRDLEGLFVIRFREDGTLLFVNEEYARLFSRHSFEIEGGVSTLRTPDEDRRIFFNALEQVKNTGYSSTEFRIVHPQGDLRFHRWIYIAVSGTQNEYLGVGYDITSLKITQEQLKRFFEGSEEFLAEKTKELRDLNSQLYKEITEREQMESTLKILELCTRYVTDLILWFTPDGRIRFANASARRILNLPDDVTKADIRNFIHDTPFDDWSSFWNTLRESGNQFREVTLRISEEKTVPAEMLLTYIRSDEEEYCCSIGRDITSRLQAMDELIENENRFRQLAELIPDVFYLKNLKNNEILYINPAFIHIYGRSPVDLRNNPDLFLTAIHPDDRDLICPVFSSYKNEVQDLHFRIVRPDGEIRSVRMKRFVVTDSSGLPFREGGLIHDITHQLRMEGEIQFSSELLKATLSTFPVTTFAHNTDLIYTWIANSGMGINPDEIIGRTDTEVFPGSLGEELTRFKKTVLDSGKENTHNFLIPYGEDQKRIKIYIKPLIDPRGNIFGIAGAIIDLTDELQIQESLKQSEERCSLLMEGVSEGLIFLKQVERDGYGPDFELRDINSQACQLIGRAKEDLLGSLLSLYSPALMGEWIYDLEKILIQKFTRHYEGFSEFTGRYLSGNVIPVNNGEVALAFHDISDLVRCHEQIETLHACIGSLTRMKSPSEIITEVSFAFSGTKNIDAMVLLKRKNDEQVFEILYSEGISTNHSIAEPMKLTRRIHEEYVSGKSQFYTPKNLVPAPIRSLLGELYYRSVAVYPICDKDSIIGLVILASQKEEGISVQERYYHEILASLLTGLFSHVKRGGSYQAQKSEESRYQIIGSDFSVIDGSAPTYPDGSAIGQVRDLIKNRKEMLITGQEVSEMIEWPEYDKTLWQLRIRFIPWDASLAYLVLWKRA